MNEYFETERTIKQIFENMFIQHPKAKEMMFMYMHSDNKYDYFKDALTKKYIKAKNARNHTHKEFKHTGPTANFEYLRGKVGLIQPLSDKVF